MAILGIGTDVVELGRISAAIDKNEKFAARILTEKECEICLNPKPRIESIAGRFAAKEAVGKAMGTGIGKLGLRNIEILNEESGAPKVYLHGSADSYAKEKGVTAIHLSISHERSVAVAMVVLEGEPHVSG